ncbi:Uncharacterized protein Adt_12000 [Abeliophyllum distichum]|uniref:Uncharacterized protein n=1 Tax=Abeliophyllum distichum TaxID=126358 RepID=A0ABD1UPG6_9LAMI
MDRHRPGFASFHSASSSSENHCQPPTFSILSSTTLEKHWICVTVCHVVLVYPRCQSVRSLGSTEPHADHRIYATKCRSSNLRASTVEIPSDLRDSAHRSSEICTSLHRSGWICCLNIDLTRFARHCTDPTRSTRPTTPFFIFFVSSSSVRLSILLLHSLFTEMGRGMGVAWVHWR